MTNSKYPQANLQATPKKDNRDIALAQSVSGLSLSAPVGFPLGDEGTPG
jgi:hypothetical protein